MIELKNCDCLDLAKEIKEKNLKIDLILTDCPYGISTKKNPMTLYNQTIDFGEWDYNFNQKEWLEHFAPLVKDGGGLLFLTLGKIYIL